jgi:hypothetical protein
VTAVVPRPPAVVLRPYKASRPNKPSVGAKINAKHLIATFHFTSERATRFRCALVLKPIGSHAGTPQAHYVRCGATSTYAHLKPNRAYVLYVQAENRSGWERAPAIYAFTIR